MPTLGELPGVVHDILSYVLDGDLARVGLGSDWAQTASGQVEDGLVVQVVWVCGQDNRIWTPVGWGPKFATCPPLVKEETTAAEVEVSPATEMRQQLVPQLPWFILRDDIKIQSAK